jgi:uncharacterized protein YhaN
VLEKALLTNFQKWGRLEIEFDPRLTVLYGDSEAGKSAVLRAVLWACLNTPRGRAMVGRWGEAPYARVKLTADGHAATRTSGAGVNTYSLDGHTLGAVGASVPKAVADLLNVGPDNFQGQHDPPFWFSLTPGEAARRFNAIVNLSAIDAALSAAAARVRRAKAVVGVTQARLGDAKARKAGHGWAVRFDRLVAKAERLSSKKAALAAKAARMRQDCAGWLQATRIANRLSDAVRANVAQLNAIRDAATVSLRVSALKAAVAGWERCRRSAAVALPPDPGPAWAAYRTMADRRQLLARAVAVWESIAHTVEFSDLQISAEKERLNQLTGGVCPTCLRPLTD